MNGDAIGDFIFIITFADCMNKGHKATIPNKIINNMKTYPLLQSQLGVFYDCLKYPQVMQYNIPCITKLTDDIDLDRVEKTIQAIFAAGRGW